MLINFKPSFSIFILCLFGVFNLWAQEAYDNYYTSDDSADFLSDENLKNRIDLLNLDLHFLNAAVFHLTNIERSNADLPLFGFHENLYKSAAIHSESMNEHDYFDHINRIQKKWRTPKDRILYFDSSYRSLAENILENNLLEHKGDVLEYRTVKNSDGTLLFLDLNGQEIKYGTYLFIAKRLVLQWMNSPPHRANILDVNLRLLGCFCAIDKTKIPVLIRCTQNFGSIK
tara:strand:- start:2302 stop:2988 length:687 start_codon:yes stop_codon:yes gene_type:complete